MQRIAYGCLVLAAAIIYVGCASKTGAAGNGERGPEKSAFAPSDEGRWGQAMIKEKSNEESDCPNIVEEPVSMCRAKIACGGKSLGSKILTALSMMLSGAGAGAHGHNQAAAQNERCIDDNLDAQRSSAGLPVATRVHCESIRTSNNTVETNCR